MKSTNKISFGEKFGCMPGETSEFLLRKARELGVNVNGIAFHIGIGCLEYEIFGRAISVSAEAFKYGKSLGHKMDLLDIGGGFPGHELETIVKQKIQFSLKFPTQLEEFFFSFFFVQHFRLEFQKSLMKT